MLFIIIYGITGWKIKKGNRAKELWDIWKRSATMEAVTQILYGIHWDIRLGNLKDEQMTVWHILLPVILLVMRYGALITLYKGWKKYPLNLETGASVANNGETNGG